MTVYFTASIAGKQSYEKHYQAIINILAKKGHTVISEHIMDTAQSHIHLESREELDAFHNQLEQWIGTCDFVLAETSYPSISVGYEISLARERRKPVLILYRERHPPSLFVHSRDENIVCEQYTMGSLEDSIQSFINYVSGVHDMRFTFFITPAIAAHMEKVSKARNIPKSAYLRSLIEQDIHHAS